jgi:hypothetical protein
MGCPDIERAISGQQRLTTPKFSPPVVVHLEQCVDCRELVSLLTDSDPTPRLSGVVLDDLEHRILLDLKPVKPIPSAFRCGAGFAATFLALVVIGAWRLKASALGAMSPMLCAAILLALGLSAVFLIASLVRQMVPGSRHAIRPDFLPFAVFTVLGGLFVIALPHRVETISGRLGGFACPVVWDFSCLRPCSFGCCSGGA